jgi:hypothetical protein
MANRHSRKNVASQQKVTTTDAAVDTPTVEVVTVTAKPTAKRLPFAEAHAHNKVFGFVTPDAAVSADVAYTAKGTNMRKLRVYGYDNLSSGGGVPKDAMLVMVAGITDTPKGCADAQWAALQGMAGKTVAHAYDNGVSSRTVRRAYRAGAIRFSK